MTDSNPDSSFSSDYPSWQDAEIRRQDELVRMNRIAQTARGTMEYALLGEGPVVMGIHGGPGGFDQALFLFDSVTAGGFSLLAPSRPGYLGTPLVTGKTPEEQADACAALLDTLGIDKVSLIFGSAGGASGYLFAIRHPDRVRCLVAIDAVVSKYPLPANAGALAEAIFLSGPGEQVISYLSTHYPEKTLHELLRQESLLRPEEIERQVKTARNDPFQMRLLLRLVRSMSEYPRRKAGVENDLEQFARLPDLPVEKIRCPALIIHGTHDSDVLFYHGVYARTNIPGAEDLWVREGSHLCAWISPQAREVQARILAFLQKYR